MPFNSYNLPDSPCNSCKEGDSYTDASCIRYTGPGLLCSTISTGDDMETALQKIDQLLCSSSGDYSSYEKSCLTDYWGSPILTESVFVNAISNFVCKTRTDLDSFIQNSYTNNITNINNNINGILNPNFTCSSASITNADGYYSILNKFCSKFSELDDALDISMVVWNNCSTVINPPTSIGQGFQLLSDQICSMSSGNVVLPTFNNINSCLLNPTASDSLEDTISKIKTKLCSLPTYSYTNITWGCIGVPASSELESGLQKIVNKVNQITQVLPVFNVSDFSVTQTDPLNSCAGITVSLATPINQDRWVASDNSDTSPGTLQDKLQQGSNVTLDYTTPGKVIISSTGGSDTNQVLGSSTDDTPGYLIDKMGGGGNNGVTVAPYYNPTTKKVELGVDVLVGVLFDLMLSELDNNPDLYAKFCEKTRNCPSPCLPPTNVQAIQVVIPTTTTTTTTTP